MYYVYLIINKQKEKYFGQSEDLRKRIHEHNSNQSDYTKGKGPWEIVYYEAYKSKKDALKREYQLKRFSKVYQMLVKRLENSLI